MRYRVLGPLKVETDTGPASLGGQKERLLLALLLTRPNQVVAVEALVAGLWGEHPPPTAAKTLQSHVVRLRRALEPARARGAAGEVLVTREPGYLLRVAPGSLDAARFEELTTQARRALSDGRADDAVSLLREALGLWRGRAFEEFLDTDAAAAEGDRLAELRLVALEDRIEADLRLGRPRELVAELEGLVRDQPLRERPWAQLLVALYRSGRQADALLAYQRARKVLVEELGIDPGAELRRLQAAILAQDPGLDLLAPARRGRRPARPPTTDTTCGYTLDPSPAGTWSAPDLRTAARLIKESGTSGMKVTVWSYPLFADVSRYFVGLNDSRNKAQMGACWYNGTPSPASATSYLRCGAFEPNSGGNLNTSELCDGELDSRIDHALSLQVNDPANARSWTGPRPSGSSSRRGSISCPDVSATTSAVRCGASS